MASIKLVRCGPNGYHNPDEFHARVPSLFYIIWSGCMYRSFKTYVQFVNLLCAFVGGCVWSCSEFCGNTTTVL